MILMIRKIRNSYQRDGYPTAVMASFSGLKAMNALISGAAWRKFDKIKYRTRPSSTIFFYVVFRGVVIGRTDKLRRGKRYCRVENAARNWNGSLNG